MHEYVELMLEYMEQIFLNKKTNNYTPVNKKENHREQKKSRNNNLKSNTSDEEKYILNDLKI
jgi:hypothetical protein